MIDYKNIPPIFAVIIGHKYATLYEIKEHLYYEDCLDLLEIIQVDAYNERMRQELAELEA